MLAKSFGDMTVECEIRGTCQAKADTLRGEKQSDRCNWAEGHLEVQVENGDDIGGIRRSSSRARDNAVPLASGWKHTSALDIRPQVQFLLTRHT